MRIAFVLMLLASATGCGGPAADPEWSQLGTGQRALVVRSAALERPDGEEIFLNPAIPSHGLRVTVSSDPGVYQESREEFDSAVAHANDRGEAERLIKGGPRRWEYPDP